jgi:hypothetical protein
MLRSWDMQHLLDTTAEQPPTTTRQRVVIVGAALVVTSLICLLALLLGSWAYHVRLLTGHEGRLARLLAQKPGVDQVTQALENEKSPLVASSAGLGDLEGAIAMWGTKRAAEIRTKASRTVQTRVFRAGEGVVVYFLFFDQGGVLVDFTCVLQ